MGWATAYIARLLAGKTVSFRPRGGSMAGRIEDVELVRPWLPWRMPVLARRSATIVLCKVNGFEYLHLVKAMQGERFRIGNNRGGINGWIGVEGHLWGVHQGRRAGYGRRTTNHGRSTPARPTHR